MPVGLAQLRRELAQRMGFWKGDYATLGAGTLAGTQSTTIVQDTKRSEPDGEFDNAWLCISPGTANVVWTRIAQYTQAGGFQLVVPLSQAPTNGTTYDIFKVAEPNQWLQAINYAITRAFPQRHVPIDFTVPEDPRTRVYDYNRLAIEQAVANPTSLTGVTVNTSDGSGKFDPGTWYVSHSWLGPRGETLNSTVVPVTITTLGQVITIPELTAPDGVIGVRYFVSIDPGSTNVASITETEMRLSLVTVPNISVTTPPGEHVQAGLMVENHAPAIDIVAPAPETGQLPQVYNTTATEILELYGVQRLVNAGQSPEIWQDLGSSGWQPIGGTRIQIQFKPYGIYSLRFVGSGTVPTLATETDVTQEPKEMLLAGAEFYMWHLLDKTSTLAATNWEKQAAMAEKDYMSLKNSYALDQPREVIHRPAITVSY